jgi:hypothetical protein
MKEPGSSDLARKLRLKSGMRLRITHAPAELDRLLKLPDGAAISRARSQQVDCLIAFVRNQADVAATVPLFSSVKSDGLIWFCYPKKSGPIKTDITRDVGWEAVRAAGFDSVAQISVDAAWTGFRFRETAFIKSPA